ncbi:hypothetical protein CBOM_03485 [Ceraceosorus bombacis]|uniref:Uncharacterized protein n=1 Tax=Ceraceosorus bombacis TaxID=401625 RepID=A0A0P1BL91_9BASI|nr:hypothetical protein CBOM_03485 [Ceraceosorus bombacis]
MLEASWVLTPSNPKAFLRPLLAADDIKNAIHEEQDGSSNPSSSSGDTAATQSGSVGGVFGPGLAPSARASSASRPTTRPLTCTSISSAGALACDGNSDSDVYMPSYLATLCSSTSGSRLQVLHPDAPLSAHGVPSAPGFDGLDAVTGTPDLAPGLSSTGSSESVISMQAPSYLGISTSRCSWSWVVDWTVL